jgi:hypothetical protein
VFLTLPFQISTHTWILYARILINDFVFVKSFFGFSHGTQVIVTKEMICRVLEMKRIS